MKILITGITGFVGPHLARYIQTILPGSHQIYGTVKNRSDVSKVPIGVLTVECELTDPKNADDVVQQIKPDIIFHLAAQSFVQTSWKSPADTLTNNILSELNILEAVRKYSPECIVHVAGSSEEYGKPVSTPITESHELNPLSPYGVSKVTQEKLAYQYHQSYGIRTVITRAFNHTGPGRDPRFAEASFAHQIAKKINPMQVGNLEAIRDYTDVRDMVRAYWLAANAGLYGEPMNISSGVGHSMSDVITWLVNIADYEPSAHQDPARMRPSDIPVLIGDSTKFRELTGWAPEIPFEQTLADLYRSFL